MNGSPQEPPASPFAAIYDATADSMRAEFNRLRASLTHSGTRGDAAEEIVRRFLEEALPSSLGVAVGQVVDSHGNFSGESDVIVYNAARTPMLFSSAQGGKQTVPIEGVIAVVEVKSRLQKKDLSQLVNHAQRLKNLERRAYIAQTIRSSYRLYDQQWEYLPALYSVFAFSSDDLYVSELNKMQTDTPLHQRVDNLCALDRGLALNICLTGHIDDPESVFSFGPTATRLSKLGEVSLDNPLLPWFAINSSVYAQSDCPPINIGLYVQDQLRLAATMPPGNAGDFRDELCRQMAEKLGVSVETVSKIGGTSSGPLSLSEVLGLVEPYRKGLFNPGTPEGAQMMESLSRLTSDERDSLSRQLASGDQFSAAQ